MLQPSVSKHAKTTSYLESNQGHDATPDVSVKVADRVPEHPTVANGDCFVHRSS